MIKNKKRLVTSVAALSMVAVLGAGSMFAYLTDNDSATNTFTVGNVDIELQEKAWTSAGYDTESKGPTLVCNEIVAKDPKIHNAGNESAIVFMTVDVPIPEENINFLANNGSMANTGKTTENLFYFGTENSLMSDNSYNKSTGSESGGWVQLGDVDESSVSGKWRYTFAYDAPLAASTDTSTLFDYVQLRNFKENVVADAQQIDVKAYAIQASNVFNNDGEDLTQPSSGTISSANLQTIYDTYVAQQNVE